MVLLQDGERERDGLFLAALLRKTDRLLVVVAAAARQLVGAVGPASELTLAVTANKIEPLLRKIFVDEADRKRWRPQLHKHVGMPPFTPAAIELPSDSNGQTDQVSQTLLVRTGSTASTRVSAACPGISAFSCVSTAFPCYSSPPFLM